MWSAVCKAGGVLNAVPVASFTPENDSVPDGETEAEETERPPVGRGPLGCEECGGTCRAEPPMLSHKEIQEAAAPQNIFSKHSTVAHGQIRAIKIATSGLTELLFPLFHLLQHPLPT